MEALKELKEYQQKIIERLLGKFHKINSMDALTIEQQETMECCNCGKNRFVKNGTHKGSQRYKCKECGKTQYHDVNTCLYNLKHKDKWIDFILLMLDKEQKTTCQAIADELGINKKTAHDWRHRFLKAIEKHGDMELGRELELDEVYLPFCVKGRIGKEKYDEYFTPGHPDNIESQLRKEERKMEEESYQVIFMCTHNRMRDFNFSPIKVQKKGIVGQEDVRKSLAGFDLSGMTVITDSEPSLKAYLNTCEGLEHRTFKSSDVKNGEVKDKGIHNNNINNTMMRLKNWLKDFFGVSTKYLSNYLLWFRFRDSFELDKIRPMVAKSVQGRDTYNKYQNAFLDYSKFLNIKSYHNILE